MGCYLHLGFIYPAPSLIRRWSFFHQFWSSLSPSVLGVNGCVPRVSEVAFSRSTYVVFVAGWIYAKSQLSDDFPCNLIGTGGLLAA